MTSSKFAAFASGLIAFVMVSTQGAFAGCTSNLLPMPNVGSGVSVLAGISGSGPSDVWGVGWSGQAGVIRTLVEHYDGFAWTVIPSPNNPNHPGDTLNSVSVFSASDAWAVGSMGHQTRPFVAHWNGSAWSEVLVPRFTFGGRNIPAQHLVSVSVNPANSNDVWAVGNVPSGGIRNEPSFIYSEHWNGAKWTIYPLPAMKFPIVFGVATAPDGEAWVVGGDFGSGLQFSIAHWNGSQWLAQDSVGTHDRLFGISAPAFDDVWAVGTRIEHFDGQSWQPSLRPGLLTVLSVSPRTPTDVWAAGPNETVAHFDGRKWSTVSQPFVKKHSAFDGIFALPNGAITAGFVGNYLQEYQTLSTLTLCQT